jgi:hypothetical protein
MTNQVVFKKELAMTDLQTVLIQAGAEILFAGDQHGTICIWYRCDPEDAFKPRLISVVGTGNPYPGAEGRHLGTVVLEHFVWHVFERTI